MSNKRADQSPEDKSRMDIPVDLTSPRVQAAMRIMGATVQNLTPRPPPDLKKEGMTAAQQSLAKTRHEKNEIRRKRLLQEIDDTANALQEADVDALLSPNVVSPPATTSPAKEYDKFLTPSMKDLFEKMADKQKDDFEETKKRSRAEIQRMLVEKIGANERQELENKKLEEEKRILNDQRKEQKSNVVAAAQKRDTKHAKNAERLGEMQKAERIRMRELSTKLKETCDVAFEKAKQTRAGDEGKRQENRERMERINESKNRNHEELHAKRTEAYERQIANEEILKDRRLEEKHAQMLQRQDEWGAKFAKKMNAVQLKQHDDEVKRETEYKERAEKLGDARARADELQKEKLEKLSTEKNKRLNKLGANQAANKEQYKASVKKWKQQASKIYDGAAENDAKQMLMDTREMMTSMVQETKARIKRADEYARNQTIARVTSNAARVQALMEQKEYLQKQRATAIKESLIEKSTMKVTIENIKDPHPKKVNQLLKTMDLPLLPTEKKQEGEEGQENK
eukprot:gnl/MRDRNA2_/MRDRNA2_87818_c0_seq1.p1 gnl/MRDRNA2_/MRDRNA2_87818_c0~~gnl/MRDRNA2_/MRDRNA2_87818_c0_seq1.p1  ORF type:complete len:513 (-),score=174.62 gnl/MRDRNA2_/MRDRNA2_87818_c0_seq1:70-1608(-)